MDVGAKHGTEDLSSPGLIPRVAKSIQMRHQYWLDKLTPYTTVRWVAFASLTVIFFIRIVYLQGWYVVCYALGIYLLNIFLLFLTPKIDPALASDSDGPSLPTRVNEEFRPFMRRLPEFKFWYSGFRAVVIGLLCTCFDVLNVPVFWPILVLYFVLLFSITMRRQIQHMIKYRYLPWSRGKTKYQGKEDRN